MSRQYFRRCALVIEGRRFDSSILDGFDNQTISTGFRISFEVEQTLDKAKANKASAKIYNLSESSRFAFAEAKRPSFQIWAGYHESIAMIFDGEAVNISSKGVETSIAAADGLQAKRGIVSASLAPGADLGVAIETVANKMGVNAKRAIAKAKQGNFKGALKTFTSGLTMSASADVVMNELAEGAGFEWTIVNGELVILDPSGLLDPEIVILGPTSGLIDSPERKVDDKRPGQDIVSARALLQPRITVGRLVRLESKEISGDFKVTKVRHFGDTDAAEWYSDIEGIAL